MVVFYELGLALGRVSYFVNEPHEDLNGSLSTDSVLCLLKIPLESFEVVLLDEIHAHLI